MNPQTSCIKWCFSGNGLEIILNSNKCQKTFAKLQNKDSTLKITGIVTEKLQ